MTQNEKQCCDSAGTGSWGIPFGCKAQQQHACQVDMCYTFMQTEQALSQQGVGLILVVKGKQLQLIEVA